MKENYLARLKAKFPAAASLAKKRLDSIEAKLDAKKVTDDASIDAELDALNEAFAFSEIAKFDDQKRNYEAKLKEAALPKDKIENPDGDADPGKPGDQPADPVLQYLQKLEKKLDTQNQEIATLRGEKVADTFKAKAQAELKDVPIGFWKGRPIPQEDEKFNAFVAEVKADHQEFLQQQTNQGFQSMGQPRSGVGGAVGGKEATNEELDEVMKGIQI